MAGQTLRCNARGRCGARGAVWQCACIPPGADSGRQSSAPLPAGRYLSGSPGSIDIGALFRRKERAHLPARVFDLAQMRDTLASLMTTQRKSSTIASSIRRMLSTCSEETESVWVASWRIAAVSRTPWNQGHDRFTYALLHHLFADNLAVRPAGTAALRAAYRCPYLRWRKISTHSDAPATAAGPPAGVLAFFFATIIPGFG